MEKVIRDGKVAVLYSPGYGAGWLGWHGNLQLLFHPELVALVEQNRREEITEELVAKILNLDSTNNSLYLGGADQLEIRWLDEGTLFQVREYDGSEWIETLNDQDWITA